MSLWQSRIHRFATEAGPGGLLGTCPFLTARLYEFRFSFMTKYLSHQFDRDDFDLISVTDEMPMWSAPFGIRLLDTIQLKPNLNVLDIGCGMGFPLVEVAERLGPSCTVYGIDPWEQAVNRVRLKLKTYGITNVRVSTDSAEAMPFDDSFFDLLVSNNGINNVQDIEKSLSECCRVCRRGAQFVLTFNLPESMIEFYTDFQSVLARHDLRDSVIAMQEHIQKKRPSVSRVEFLLKTSGFEIVSTRQDSFNLRYLNAEAMFHHHFIKYWFLDSWKGLVAQDHWQSVFGDLERTLNRRAQRDGEIKLTIPYACIDCRKR